jgi:hypothetical protein
MIITSAVDDEITAEETASAAPAFIATVLSNENELLSILAIEVEEEKTGCRLNVINSEASFVIGTSISVSVTVESFCNSSITD